MNLRQKKFADNYIETGNIEQSALDAGYSVKYSRSQSYKLLANVGIKEYIDIKLQELEKKKIAKQDEVLQYLTSIMRGNEKEQTLIGVGYGEQTIESIDVSSRERLKAAELLGKRYLLFTDKVSVDGDLGISLVVDYGEEDGED